MIVIVLSCFCRPEALTPNLLNALAAALKLTLNPALTLSKLSALQESGTYVNTLPTFL